MLCVTLTRRACRKRGPTFSSCVQAMAVDLMEQESLMILELEKHVSILPSLHGSETLQKKGRLGCGVWLGFGGVGRVPVPA